MKVYVITGYGERDSLGSHIADVVSEMDPDCFIIGVAHNSYADIPLGGSANTIMHCDLRNMESLNLLCETILTTGREIYCLVNCAGANYMDFLEKLEYGGYRNVMDVNLTAPIFMTKNLLPSLTGGIVLNIASSSARKPLRTSLAYCVSKAGLVMATKQIAREVTAKHDVVVFAISPNQLEDTGLTKMNDVAIPIARGWTKAETEAYRKANSICKDRPTARTTAEFIGFLITDKNRCKHLSGSEIHYGE